MGNVVLQLNEVIQIAVNNANSEHGRTQVHYVDVESRFDYHRWCENPNVEFHEPNEGRDDTWFFLSSWRDVPINGDADVSFLQLSPFFALLYSKYSRQNLMVPLGYRRSRSCGDDGNHQPRQHPPPGSRNM